MTAIGSILAATDFSEGGTRAVRRAARLAGELGASLKLLHVLRLRASESLQQPLLDDAKSRLDALAKEVQSDAKSAPEGFVRAGNVLEEILAAADHADVLVLGSLGQRPVQELLIGTTAERLLGMSRRPMLVVRQEPRSSYQTVFVPVDFSVHSMAVLQFARHLVPGARFLIFHAYEGPSESQPGSADAPGESASQWQMEYRAQALANLENLLQRTGMPLARTTPLLESGKAKLLVTAKAAEHGADLIVMGKHSRSMVSEFLLGSVTRQTLTGAACDVAVVPNWPRL